MNYVRVKELEKKIYNELTELDKKEGKTKQQEEKYKKYLFLKKLKEELINEQQSKEPFKFNYK